MNKVRLELFEAELRKFFDGKRGRYPSRLYQAMEYSLFSGGKRIRPQLMLMSADFTGTSYERVMPLALALECIHTYSLIHDDLPCMDNDVLRRGVPTNHVKFGEDIALLAGDSLLNLAFETLIYAIKNDSDCLSAVELITQNAGAEGMIGGKAMEFSHTVPELDQTLITELYRKKTGALIAAAVLSPCLISLCYEKLPALSAYGAAIGLAFQLKDDLLEATEEEKSYLSIMGREQTEKMLSRLTETAKNALRPFGAEGKELYDFCDFLQFRSH